jgi:hypothetical protein
MGALAGGLTGGVFGALGGIFGAMEQEDFHKWYRKAQQKGMDQGRALTEERVGALMDDPLISAARNYLQSSFAEDGTDPLSEQFGKRLRVAQEARGLRRTTAGAVAEASSMAAFRQQHLAGMLPQMRQFGTLGEDYRQRILTQEIPWGVAYETGSAVPGITPRQYSPGPLSSGFAGFTSGMLGGAQIGQSMTQDNPFEQFMAQAASNERFETIQDQLDQLINDQTSGGYHSYEY